MSQFDELAKFAPVRGHGKEEEPAGPVKVTVEYVKEGDRRHTLHASDGSTHTLGRPIEALRREFGGNTGVVTDPWGQERQLELEPGMPDGRGIRVVISYRFVKKNRPPPRRP